MKKVAIVLISVLVLVFGFGSEWRYCLHCLIQERTFFYMFVEIESLSEYNYDEYGTSEQYNDKCEYHVHNFDVLEKSQGLVQLSQNEIASTFNVVASEYVPKCI